MDVTGWDLASRTKLPEWCFGQRQVVSARIYNIVNLSTVWDISDVALPDPCFIWNIGMNFRRSDDTGSFLRMGLLANVATSSGEMDAADEILPDYGKGGTSPRRIYTPVCNGLYIEFKIHKPMVTGGKKFAVEGYCYGSDLRLLMHMVVSGMPTKVPGWPGAWPAG